MEEIAYKYWNLNTSLHFYLILLSSKILIQVFAFNKIYLIKNSRRGR